MIALLRCPFVDVCVCDFIRHASRYYVLHLTQGISASSRRFSSSLRKNRMSACSTNLLLALRVRRQLPHSSIIACPTCSRVRSTSASSPSVATTTWRTHDRVTRYVLRGDFPSSSTPMVGSVAGSTKSTSGSRTAKHVASGSWPTERHGNMKNQLGTAPAG